MVEWHTGEEGQGHRDEVRKADQVFQGDDEDGVELATRRLDTISFSVHVPMLMNRKKLAEVLEKFDTPMLRSVYGNVCEVPYIFHEDVKIYDMTTLPDPEWEFVSTQENTFTDGKVGEFIRAKFREPSRFEKQRTVDVHEHYTEEGDMI